jgi:hypothetical protein
VSPDRPPRQPRFRHPERLLPFACVAAAATLFASELMTTFQFIPPGGEALCTQQAADRHHFALGVLAIFAVGAVVVAVLGASKPAAMAVAVAGLLALLLFLILDLPDANNLGTLGDSCTVSPGQFSAAKAVPQAGFWLEMASALALALSGAALATLTPDQLATLRPRRRGGPRDAAGPQPPAATTTPLPNPGSTPAGRNPAGSGGSADAPADRPARARGARRG